MPKTRDTVFNRVVIDYAIRGTARITWELKPRFGDAQPYVFQLQASRTGGEDWVDVGTPIENAYYALDAEQRLYGQDRRLVYRVRLETPLRTHYSDEATVIGKLHMRQWLQAREIIRQLELDSRGMECFQGFLLKRRIAGQKCTDCQDPLMDGIRNSDCTNCKGVGFVDGYFLAAATKMYEMSPDIRETHNREGRGTRTEGAVGARFVGLPLIHNRDVWVDQHGDRRYFIGKVDHLSEMNQVPLAVQAELSPIEFSDIAYTVEVPS